MGSRGFAPRPGPLSRARDTRRRDAALITLVLHGQVFGPDLPDDYDWDPRTRAWWDAWRRSPQARFFDDLDWSHLQLVAVMHARMWQGHAGAAREVRVWGAMYGATMQDRARLGWRVVSP